MLEEGDDAPDFEAPDQQGERVRLSDHEKVVLYFYPKDDTPGCTKEACNFRDHVQGFKESGWTVIGVSTDDVDSHKQFANKYDLGFTLVADPDGAIAEQYDVLGEENFVERITYVIENGEIQRVFEDVDPDRHALEVLVSLGKL